MQTHRKKPAPRRPDVRSLKIQPRLRTNKYANKNVPEIRLTGVWLQLIGFNSDCRVTVTYMPQLIIIRPVE